MTGEVDVLPLFLKWGHRVIITAASKTSGVAKALLLGSTALCLAIGVSSVALSQAHAQVTPSEVSSFNIRAQDLGSALNAFADRAGLRLLFPSGLVAGKRSSGLSGAFTREQALARLLAGSDLSYRFTDARTVTIVGPAGAGAGRGASVEGAIQLDTIDVSGARVPPSDVPYQTAAPVSYISSQTIERFRGSSPADIFRGTPGVLSGEARNGGGGIDVNIRGMQGMGRVAVTIDGAENGLAVYQGYQGVSNRSYVDPDFLAGVDITKGSDASSRGISGTVAMRTLSAEDVVKPGEKWGVWVKSGFNTNTTSPRAGDRGGYSWPQPYVSDPQPYPVPTAQASGVDRPMWLDPTGGSFSTVAAVKEENYDLLWGYAYRKQGNYYAGKNGPSADVIDTGPQPLCYSSGFCYYPPSPISYAHVYQNGGISSYRAGEQVLNTQLETESYLAKATVRDDNGQSLQIGYNGYRSRAGDQVASLLSSLRTQATQQTQENIVNLDTGTVRYRWKPEENGLIDLKANYWITSLNLRTPARVSSGSTPPETYGLPFNYLPGNDSVMWGTDVSNRSHVGLGRFGTVDLDYGVSYLSEATAPLPYTDQINLNIPARNGKRQEISGYGKIAYKPVEWLTVNGGLRYSTYKSLDRSSGISNALQVNSKPEREDSGYSPSAGVVIEPVKGMQFYTNYSSALRMPTLFESVAAYTLIPNPDVSPERSNNWEAGVNLIKDDLLSSGDKTMLKFGYFNWDVKDYVARVGITGTVVMPTYSYTWTGLQVRNIDRARFEGLEFSGRYVNSGFTADFAANYYLNVQYCYTAGQCSDSTLSGDYATNHVPPEYSASLTLSQKLLNDDVTVGGRVLYNGPRAIGHGAIQYGAAAIIAPIVWKPYWLVDVFTEYKLSKDITLWATVENVVDQYYVDPLSLVQQPGPGRTARLGLTGKFGGSELASPFSLASLWQSSRGAGNWTGFHVGVNAAQNHAKEEGTTAPMNGAAGSRAWRESPDLSIKALSFGGQIGYDYQFANRVVLGVEADFARSAIGGSQATYSNEGSSCACGDNLFRLRALETVRESKVEWLSTVRGRLGYAFGGGLMVYATGGLAVMEQTEKRVQYLAFRNGTGLFTPVTGSAPDFTEEASLTRVGYAIGGGAEYMIDNHWSVKADYLLTSFGEKEVTFPGAKAGVMIANGYGYPVTSANTEGRTVSSKIDIPMVKLGVNYRF